MERITITATMLGIVGLLLPLIIQIVISSCHGEKDDAHCTICVYAIATGLTICITDAVKNYAGYLRPNFYNRCVFNEEIMNCTGSKEMDARKSFPSGHSSLTFCSMTILTLYLLRIFGVGDGLFKYHNDVGRRKVNTAKRRLTSMLLCLSTMSLSFFVAGSRVHDNYHHPADVAGGAVIGCSCAIVVYNTWLVCSTCAMSTIIGS